MTAIDRLNELLEAERAGVDTLSRLFPEARSPEMQKLFEEIRNDQAGEGDERADPRRPASSSEPGARMGGQAGRSRPNAEPSSREAA
jgi:hypothetical protein